MRWKSSIDFHGTFPLVRGPIRGPREYKVPSFPSSPYEVPYEVPMTVGQASITLSLFIFSYFERFIRFVIVFCLFWLAEKYIVMGCFFVKLFFMWLVYSFMNSSFSTLNLSSSLFARSLVQNPTVYLQKSQLYGGAARDYLKLKYIN